MGCSVLAHSGGGYVTCPLYPVVDSSRSEHTCTQIVLYLVLPTPESPLDYKDIYPVRPKGNQS